MKYLKLKGNIQKQMEEWELRSSFYKNDKRGVLYKNFPTLLNDYIHQWHLQQILEVLPIRNKIKVLDFGCGYGRLAKEIVKRRLLTRVDGVDIAREYINLYNQNLREKGKAFWASITELPFQDESYDFVFMVTTLMYLEKERDQQKAINELFRVLKKGERGIIIENHPLGQGFGRLWKPFFLLLNFFQKSKKPKTTGVSFSERKMAILVSKGKGKIIAKKRCPLFSFSLVFSIILNKISPKITEFFLELVGKLDKKLEKIPFSAFVSYEVKK